MAADREQLTRREDQLHRDDPYNAETNKEGYINLSLEQNMLCPDLMKQKLRTTDWTKVLEESMSVNPRGGVEVSTLEAMAGFINKFCRKGLAPFQTEELVIVPRVDFGADLLGQILFDSGDVVLVPAPYSSRLANDFGERGQVRIFPVPGLCGRRTELVNKFEKAYKDAGKKVGNVRATVKAITLVNPQNPEGGYFSPEELVPIVEWAVKKNLYIILDETYNLAIYDNDRKYESATELFNTPQARLKLIWLWGLSKNFSIPGLKATVLRTQNPDVRTACIRHFMDQWPSINDQFIAREFINDHNWIEKDFLRSNLERLKKARDQVLVKLIEWKVSYTKPKSGFFVLVDFSKYLNKKDEERQWHEKFLNQKVIIGETAPKPGFFRIFFTSVDSATLDEGLRRIGTALQGNQVFGATAQNMERFYRISKSKLERGGFIYDGSKKRDNEHWYCEKRTDTIQCKVSVWTPDKKWETDARNKKYKMGLLKGTHNHGPQNTPTGPQHAAPQNTQPGPQSPAAKRAPVNPSPESPQLNNERMEISPASPEVLQEVAADLSRMTISPPAQYSADPRFALEQLDFGSGEDSAQSSTDASHGQGSVGKPTRVGKSLRLNQLQKIKSPTEKNIKWPTTRYLGSPSTQARNSISTGSAQHGLASAQSAIYTSHDLSLVGPPTGMHPGSVTPQHSPATSSSAHQQFMSQGIDQLSNAPATPQQQSQQYSNFQMDDDTNNVIVDERQFSPRDLDFQLLQSMFYNEKGSANILMLLLTRRSQSCEKCLPDMETNLIAKAMETKNAEAIVTDDRGSVFNIEGRSCGKVGHFVTENQLYRYLKVNSAVVHAFAKKDDDFEDVNMTPQHSPAPGSSAHQQFMPQGIDQLSNTPATPHQQSQQYPHGGSQQPGPAQHESSEHDSSQLEAAEFEAYAAREREILVKVRNSNSTAQGRAEANRRVEGMAGVQSRNRLNSNVADPKFISYRAIGRGFNRIGLTLLDPAQKAIAAALYKGELDFAKSVEEIDQKICTALLDRVPKMIVTHIPGHVPGYDEAKGWHVINYIVPGGYTTADHERPRVKFTGAKRTAYLPNNEDGTKVLEELKKAFDAGHIYKVGDCETSGAKNTVIWNFQLSSELPKKKSGIPHKTSRVGGPHCNGYPDHEFKLFEILWCLQNGDYVANWRPNTSNAADLDWSNLDQ